ncbi:MAG TPA: response regulator transcription factor [Steroidobacteraceae bacterium]|nr:response regulator transcription factor [Steroidobacteraceae bacterium]
MRILLIEDDRMIGWALHRGLTDEGFGVDWLDDGDAAVLALTERGYDGAILDLGLPNRDGLQVLAELRRLGNTLPVIVVTARESVPERIKGLNAGADDYVCKPFDFDELLARLRAVLRRRAVQTATILEHKDLKLNVATRQVVLRGQLLNVSAKEFALLEILLERPGIVFTRAQLHDKLYGWDQEIESNTLEVYIHSLRRKLGHEFIENVRSIGYRIRAA